MKRHQFMRVGAILCGLTAGSSLWAMQRFKAVSTRLPRWSRTREARHPSVPLSLWQRRQGRGTPPSAPLGTYFGGSVVRPPEIASPGSPYASPQVSPIVPLSVGRFAGGVDTSYYGPISASSAGSARSALDQINTSGSGMNDTSLNYSFGPAVDPRNVAAIRDDIVQNLSDLLRRRAYPELLPSPTRFERAQGAVREAGGVFTRGARQLWGRGRRAVGDVRERFRRTGDAILPDEARRMRVQEQLRVLDPIESEPQEIRLFAVPPGEWR